MTVPSKSLLWCDETLPLFLESEREPTISMNDAFFGSDEHAARMLVSLYDLYCDDEPSCKCTDTNADEDSASQILDSLHASETDSDDAPQNSQSTPPASPRLEYNRSMSPSLYTLKPAYGQKKRAYEKLGSPSEFDTYNLKRTLFENLDQCHTRAPVATLSPSKRLRVRSHRTVDGRMQPY